MLWPGMNVRALGVPSFSLVRALVKDYPVFQGACSLRVWCAGDCAAVSEPNGEFMLVGVKPEVIQQRWAKEKPVRALCRYCDIAVRALPSRSAYMSASTAIALS